MANHLYRFKKSMMFDKSEFDDSKKMTYSLYNDNPQTAIDSLDILRDTPNMLEDKPQQYLPDSEQS